MTPGTDRQEDGERLTDFVITRSALRSSSMKIASAASAGRSTLSSLRGTRARRARQETDGDTACRTAGQLRAILRA